MSNLSIKDVPENWAEALRQRAARHHRSLQGELMAIIETAVREPALADALLQPLQPLHAAAQLPPGTVRGTIVGYDRFGHPIIRQGWKTIEQVAAELHAKYPEPITGVDRGVDIIRAERDAR